MVNQQKESFSLIDRFDGNYLFEGEVDSNRPLVERVPKERFMAETRNIQKWNRTYPEKTPGYLYNRYLEHPIYTYDLFSISREEEIQAVIVIRKASVGEASALRVVDYIGNPDALIGTRESFQEILRQHGAEYIDFYNHGFEEYLFAHAGFVKRDESTTVVIPDHFEPFERRNIEISYAYKIAKDRSHLEDKLAFFKGDGDQDRPSVLP
jgi:hypothetical protein